MRRMVTRLTSLALVLGALACGSDGSNEPSGPSFRGRIFFIAGPTGGDSEMDIYSIRPDGSDLVNHTQFPAFYSGLASSPNGKTLLFVRAAASTLNGEIYALDADSTTVYPVTDSPQRETDVAWRRDGAKVVIRRDDATMHVMNPDGSGITFVADSAYTPTWTADGLLLYAKFIGGGGTDLHRITAAGTGDVPIVEGPGDDWEPHYNAVGTSIIYSNFGNGGSEIRRFNSQTLVIDTLTHRNDFSAFQPTISPKGDTIAFSRGVNGVGVIYMRLPGSGTLKQVTTFGDTLTAFGPAWAAGH